MYDYAALTDKLAEVKQRVLFEIIKAYFPGTAPNTPLEALARTYVEKKLAGSAFYADNESIKLVGEETVRYETVVAVMDAARGKKIGSDRIPLFPNVSITGGIVQ